MPEACLGVGAVQNVGGVEEPARVVENVHPPHVVLALVVRLRVHGGPDDQVQTFVAVDVGGRQRVPEVRADLGARDVLVVGQVPREEEHLALQAGAAGHADDDALLTGRLEVAHDGGVAHVRVVVLGRALGGREGGRSRFQTLLVHRA